MKAYWQSGHPEHREALRQTRLGYKAQPATLKKMGAFQKAWWQAHPEARIARAEQIRKQWLDPAFRQARKTAFERPDVREKFRQNRLKRHPPTKMTHIEKALCEQFRKRHLKFEMHKAMFGRWWPDFVFEGARLIIQADGDYWHRQKPDVTERDGRFNEVARAEGWTVWRFGEWEITDHPEACGRAVASFIRSHRT